MMIQIIMYTKLKLSKFKWTLHIAAVALLLVLACLNGPTAETPPPLRQRSPPDKHLAPEEALPSSAAAKAAAAADSSPPLPSPSPSSSSPSSSLSLTSSSKPTTANSQQDASFAINLISPSQQNSSQHSSANTFVSTCCSNNNDNSNSDNNNNNNKVTGHLRSEFQRYDGWYNNLANSDWGTPNSRLRRKVAPSYSDGVYQMADDGRPSARKLSQKMMRGEDGLASRRNLTTIFAFFGQVISSEILMASESGCPIEMHRIKIDKCDPMYDRECRGGRTMPFYRAAYDPKTGQSPNLPREQLNRVTSWIDGSFIYSTSETWLNTMRSFDGKGTLKMTRSALDGAALNWIVGAGGQGAIGGGTSSTATASASATTTPSTTTTPAPQIDQTPVSLYGYPLRNSKRAPLINQIPAHHLKMKTAERMFLLGDARTNQNPMILAFGILFYRWHNVLAERIHAQHPDWSDEEIFQRARRLVIASLQNIFLYEYLPTLLDTPSPYEPQTSTGMSDNNSNNNSLALTASSRQLSVSNNKQLAERQQQQQSTNDNDDRVSPYSGYKPDLHPGVSHVFQSAAFRFGHTMIPPGLYLRDDKCRFLRTPAGYKGVRLCSTWWNADEVVSQVGIERLLMGAASQIAEREDYVLCNDVRDKLFGPLDFSRRDLAALNIMRGRDNGLADYNTVRAAFKLPKIKEWREINPKLYERHPELFDELANLYDQQIDKIDLYIGGMLESDVERGRPGILFRRIIKEQFERLRDSDRFWFENLESGIFSANEIEEIRRIKLYDIIVNSTLIPDDAIQRNVFQFVHTKDPCPQPAQLASSDLQACYIVKGHSYFKGSELTYALVCLTLVIIPALCGLIAYVLVSQQDRKRRRFKAEQEYQRNIQASRQAAAAAAAAAASSSSSSSSSASGLSSASLTSNSSSNSSEDIARQSSTKCEKFYAKEWLHSNLKRKIKIRFGPAPDETIYVLDRKCQVQRSLNLSQSGPSVVLELSANYSSQYYGSGSLPSSLVPSDQQQQQVSSVVQHPLQVSTGSALGLQNNGCRTSSTISLVSGGSSPSMSPMSSPQLPPAKRGNSDSDKNDRVGDNRPSKLSASALTPLAAPSTQMLSAADLDEAVNHKPMVLLRVARNHDLVLQFCTVQHRRKFVFKLQTYLSSINKSLIIHKTQRDVMLANAETKERRQQRIEQFFREAYALTFGINGNDNGRHQTGNATGNANQQQSSSVTTAVEQQQAITVGNKISPDIGLVMRTSLTRQEFAEALGMRQDSLFVKQMFNCIDKDGNGRISFQEFLDLVVRFSRGNTDDKLRIVFDMCDHERRGVIDKSDLVRVLRSLVDIAKTKSLSEDNVMDLIDGMFRDAGLQDKPHLNYEDFKLIINNGNTGAQKVKNSGAALNLNGNGAKQVNEESNKNCFAATTMSAHNNKQPQSILAIGLDLKGAKKNFFLDTSSTPYAASPDSVAQRKMTVVDGGAHRKAIGNHLKQHLYQQQQQQDQKASQLSSASKQQHSLLKSIASKWRSLVTELEEHRQDIVYLLLFYVTVVVLFFERFINYSFLSEHMDLRHVMGVGIAITRGSAASLSFCYALLLLSMCRNIMTRIRTMSIHEYIPLDSHVKFHKIVAMTALVMTILHTVGHCVNFYHVTQQPVEHLRCLTKEMQFSGESRPTFFYWIFQTITGSTGLLLWILCSIIYVFAHQKVRQSAYRYFWSTHKLYYLIYALTLLHGSSKLTGSPRFWIFFMVPAILFTIDKIMSLQTKLLQLEIFETECLPSDVIAIKFARPPSFKFLSGQWVRLACTAFRPHEFHAFTLTSAPQDDYLSVHIRAQGPWTWKLRSLFDPANLQYNKMLSSRILQPRIRIEGPFGGGNQDWYKHEVAVMIGGGIGVTPYASILNDLVFGLSTNRYSSVNYKKVYFIWICPSHRNFEWFIDVLRDVERKDTGNLLEMHIFITQFFHKFDLRTTMLYICENHFQRISNKSLFTGLKAVNHFGRPDIAALLQYVQEKHSCVSKVGVFSCGPKAMTKSITKACEKVNKRRKLPFFSHQYENFS